MDSQYAAFLARLNLLPALPAPDTDDDRATLTQELAARETCTTTFDCGPLPPRLGTRGRWRGQRLLARTA